MKATDGYSVTAPQDGSGGSPELSSGMLDRWVGSATILWWRSVASNNIEHSLLSTKSVGGKIAHRCLGEPISYRVVLVTLIAA